MNVFWQSGMEKVRPGRWRVWAGVGFLLSIVFVALIIAGRTAPESAEKIDDSRGKTSQELSGFSLSPKSFGAADYSAFFSDVAAHGNTLSWAGQYGDLSKTTGNAAKLVLAESKKRDLTPVLIVGPGKGEVFDGIFQQSFRKTILDFIQSNTVPYLGLGNEIDALYDDSPAHYASLISTIEALTTEIRQASPNTKVFTVFQLERTKGMRGGLFGGVNNPNDTRWLLLSELENLDFIAFTTYPCLTYKTPAEIPEEYYSDIRNHTNLPVAFTEIGWFRSTPVAGWESTEQEQADFINRFSELTTRLDSQFVIWPFLYDQPVQTPFANMGLLGVAQKQTLGLTAWDTYRRRNTTVTE